MTCWTSKQGVTYCPTRGDPDVDQTTANGGGCTMNCNNSIVPSPSLPSSHLNNNTNFTAPSSDDDDELFFIILIIIVCLLCCCILIGIIIGVVRRRKMKSNNQQHGQQRQQIELKGILSKSSAYDITSTLQAGNGTKKNNKNGRKRNRKKNNKRATVLSVRNIASSNWDIVIDPTTNEQYYFNSKTNETSWNAPDIVTEALAYSQTESHRLSIESEQGGDWYPIQLDEGFAATMSTTGDVYFCHSVTGEVVWDIPVDVENVGKWVEYVTEDGYTAFRNDSTGQVSWENPNQSIVGVDMLSNPMSRDE